MKTNKVELESAIIVMSHLLKVQNFSAFKVSCLYTSSFSQEYFLVCCLDGRSFLEVVGRGSS